MAPFHQCEFERLLRLLAQAGEQTTLPDQPATRAGLNDLLMTLRTQAWMKRE